MDFSYHVYSIFGSILPNSPFTSPEEFGSSSVASWRMENSMSLRDIFPDSPLNKSTVA